MSNETKGGCLCGNGRFTLSGEFNQFHWCHCSRCRKATGSAHASNIFAKPEQINWLSGEDSVKRFDLTIAERFAKNFCLECGSPVPHVSRNGLYLVIPAGSLDDDPGIRPQDNIYWADRSAWYDEGTESPCFEQSPG